MQRLLAKHKAELQAAREKAQDSTRFDPCIDHSLCGGMCLLICDTTGASCTSAWGANLHWDMVCSVL